MSKNKTKAEIQVELEQAHKRISELESAADAGSSRIALTERQKIESDLRESEKRWQFALEGIGDGVWDLDVKTRRGFSTRAIGSRCWDMPKMRLAIRSTSGWSESTRMICLP
jgi:PAS domain-containing protein